MDEKRVKALQEKKIAKTNQHSTIGGPVSRTEEKLGFRGQKFRSLVNLGIIGALLLAPTFLEAEVYKGCTGLATAIKRMSRERNPGLISLSCSNTSSGTRGGGRPP